MNSLLNYGSDDDYDDSSEEKQTDWRETSSKDKQSTSNRQTDANYEEVQMDLSEESNESKPETKETHRKSRDRDSIKDNHKSRHDRDDHRTRSSRDRESKSRNDKDDRHHRRDRDRKSKRSSSKERRRSRSPKRSDRETRNSRSRSRSRDRNSRKYSKRYDRSGNKNNQLDKTESQKIVDDEKRNNPSNESDRFFMPGITGRFRDQIERRKQLWQKKDTEQKDNKNGQSKKVWETTTFAQDTDGKVANKFKRLMGIKGTTEASGQAVDVLKKQEEMFTSMEAQYEVARTATHTMRGVGLGFGSYQR